METAPYIYVLVKLSQSNADRLCSYVDKQPHLCTFYMTLQRTQCGAILWWPNIRIGIGAIPSGRQYKI